MSDIEQTSVTEERLDIFDEQMNFIGAALRDEVHGRGLWHRTFQCWITFEKDGKDYFLLQLRHKDKESFPNKLDKSCAGHIDAGESVIDGGMREFKEELGLDIDPSELYFCGIIPLEHQSSPDFIDREFCHIYLYRLHSHTPLTSLRLQEDEISGVFYIETEIFRQLVMDEKGSTLLSGWLLDEQGGLTPTERTVTVADFTPQSDEYHRLLFESLERFN